METFTEEDLSILLCRFLAYLRRINADRVPLSANRPSVDKPASIRVAEHAILKRPSGLIGPNIRAVLMQDYPVMMKSHAAITDQC